ncbi:amidase [Plastoroseomonas arctica]|uniref:Amidase n=1 Tax=Plastoroseomonas arctica TaxID=1509237 RepID=A0AAF1JZM1_9PROT|nr:amidase [Plastoroseomonas arctica]MBR0657517.1 amidase [Plastoroseomonas arctica]
MPEDTVGAFVPGPHAQVAGAATGPLAGLHCAIKDLYDIAGWPTTYGNPDWARTHPVPDSTATVVTMLLQAGASVVGKTKTVELAYGLTGENVWHGTPTNPAAPDRFPGGSSCGSAAAVAARLVDFAMGSDTAGSVRIPASYCGIFGIRPSWGAISLAGAAALSPPYDTPGWFARDAATLRRVGEVLLPTQPSATPTLLLKPSEAWANADPDAAESLAPAIARLEALLGPAIPVSLVPEGLATLYETFRCGSAPEVWAALGPWISSTSPEFGPGVKERFAAAAAMDPALAAQARAFRRVFQSRMHALLAGGAVLAYPTAPGPAPFLTATQAEQNAERERTISVTSIAGLPGLPEVTLPLGTADGAPVGLSLVAAPGRDLALLALAERLVP